jgi:hypothetical protein
MPTHAGDLHAMIPKTLPKKATTMVNFWCRACGLPRPRSSSPPLARPAKTIITATSSKRSQSPIVKIREVSSTSQSHIHFVQVKPLFEGCSRRLRMQANVSRDGRWSTGRPAPAQRVGRRGVAPREGENAHAPGLTVSEQLSDQVLRTQPGLESEVRNLGEARAAATAMQSVCLMTLITMCAPARMLAARRVVACTWSRSIGSPVSPFLGPRCVDAGGALGAHRTGGGKMWTNRRRTCFGVFRGALGVRSVTVLPRPASPKKVGSARSAGSGSRARWLQRAVSSTRCDERPRPTADVHRSDAVWLGARADGTFAAAHGRRLAYSSSPAL